MPRGRRYRQKKSKLAPVSRYKTQEDWDADLQLLIEGLAMHFKRLPTDEEILGFINGTPEERVAIWKAGENSGEDQDSAAEERSEAGRESEEAESDQEPGAQG